MSEQKTVTYPIEFPADAGWLKEWEPVAFRVSVVGESIIQTGDVETLNNWAPNSPRLILRRRKKLRPLTIEEAARAMIDRKSFGEGWCIERLHDDGSMLMVAQDGNRGAPNLDYAFRHYQIGIME